ncbi:ATP synthase subunit K family protein [Microdochium nivale]|nr:ATP synthase subunit K family protein [Microdochium nivale]
MVQMYNVLGRQIGSHYLAMGVLGSLFGGVTLALSGPSKKPLAQQTPPINASSSDETDFIQKFLDQADAEAKKDKH